MSLFRTELRRLAKRRFARYMALAGLLVLFAIAVGTFLTNEKVGPAQIAAAEQEAERAYQENYESYEKSLQECERAKTSGTAEETGQWPEDCSLIMPPPQEAFQAEWYMPPTFDFRNEFGEYIVAFAAILALIAFAVGASFIGAEWASGGMMNLLLWRPQRLKVLLAKAGAMLAWLTGFTVVAAALWTAGFWVIAHYRGITDGMTAGAWQSVVLAELRGLALVLVAGLVGFALASLGRHTAMALGGALGILVVGQFGLGIVLEIAEVKFVEAWLLPTYALAWIQKQVVLQEWNCTPSPNVDCPQTMNIGWQDSAVLFGVIVVLVFGAALWSMRRRDIT